MGGWEGGRGMWNQVPATGHKRAGGTTPAHHTLIMTAVEIRTHQSLAGILTIDTDIDERRQSRVTMYCKGSGTLLLHTCCWSRLNYNTPAFKLRRKSN